MTTHHINEHESISKIDRKELSDLLASVGISISDYPPDIYPPRTPYDQELWRLADLLVQLAFHKLNEQQRVQSNKESSDLLPSINKGTS
jgi:hypothetical protein